MTWDRTDLCLLAGAAWVVACTIRAAERGGPFTATVATIFLVWCMTHTAWLCFTHGFPLGPLGYFGFAWCIGKAWADLLKRFPPGGRR